MLLKNLCINYFPLATKVPARVRILLFSFFKMISFIILLKLLFSVGSLFINELELAVSQFYPSTSGGMYGGSCPPPSENWGLLTSSAIDDNPNGSPSLSEEFGIFRLPTPEFQAMITTLDFHPEPFLSEALDFPPEPLLSEEQRRF